MPRNLAALASRTLRQALGREWIARRRTRCPSITVKSVSALLRPLCSVGAQRHRHRAHPVGRRVGRQSDRRIVADARYRQDDGSALSTIADDAASWITAGLSLNDISDL